MTKKYEVTISWPIKETEFDAAKNAVDLKTVYSEFKSEYVAHATLSSGFVYCSETTDMKYSFPLPVHWLKEINNEPISPVELILNRFPKADSMLTSAHDKQFTWSNMVSIIEDAEKNAMKRVQPLVDASNYLAQDYTCTNEVRGMFDIALKKLKETS
jgi:hypothetical protein